MTDDQDDPPKAEQGETVEQPATTTESDLAIEPETAETTNEGDEMAKKAAKKAKSAKTKKVAAKRAGATKGQGPRAAQWDVDALPRASSLDAVDVFSGSNQYINVKFSNDTVLRLYPMGFGKKATATKARDVIVDWLRRSLGIK